MKDRYNTIAESTAFLQEKIYVSSPKDGDFQHVPDPIISEIVSYLPFKDRANLEKIGNHRMHNITKKSEITGKTRDIFNLDHKKGTYAHIREILNEQIPNKIKLKKVEHAIKSNPFEGIPIDIDLSSKSTLNCSLKGVFSTYGSLTLTAAGITIGITGGIQGNDLAIGLGVPSTLLGFMGIGYAFYSCKKLRKDESEKQRLLNDINKISDPSNRV